MFSLYLWLIFLCVVYVYVLWRRRKFYLLLFRLSGPMGYPVIGMAHKLRRREEIIPTFYKYESIYGPLFLSWLGPVPFLVVSEPQIAQDILTSPHCVNKSFMYDVLDDSFGRGLFSLNNPEWSVHRKALNPAFRNAMLLNFMPRFNSAANELVRNLESLLGNGEFNLSEMLQEFTLNLTAMTIMGTNLLTDKYSHLERLKIVRNYRCLFSCMTNMCFSPWLRYRLVHRFHSQYRSYEQANRDISAFIRQMIHEKTVLQPESEVSRLCHKSEAAVSDDIRKVTKSSFIDVALELVRSNEFTWKEVENEANVIFIGAFETTSNTLSNTLMLLAMFPLYQEKLFEELYTVFPQRDDFVVTYEDVQKMVYMDMVINETMRLIAPVPLIARQNTNDLELSNGLVLPSGIQIAIDIFNMQRRKEIWGPKATTFHPDHFLPTNMRSNHSYAFIPFTKGIRNCIGWRYALLSMKVTLARVLRRYHFTTSFKFSDLEFVEDITIKLKQTPKLEIHLRPE